jgi:hypothetical protein
MNSTAVRTSRRRALRIGNLISRLSRVALCLDSRKLNTRPVVGYFEAKHVVVLLPLLGRACR